MNGRAAVGMLTSVYHPHVFTFLSLLPSLVFSRWCAGAALCLLCSLSSLRRAAVHEVEHPLDRPARLPADRSRPLRRTSHTGLAGARSPAGDARVAGPAAPNDGRRGDHELTCRTVGISRGADHRTVDPSPPSSPTDIPNMTCRFRECDLFMKDGARSKNGSA
jgi:hypothetical protein